MTKILSSKYKVSRRLGVSIWGDKKDAFLKKNYRPGLHGRLSKERTKISDYGVHLRAKQRLKSHYGRINERQFKNIFLLAQKMKGNTAANFIGLLESRLDAFAYRVYGNAEGVSIFLIQQMISHGHVKVNGKRVTMRSQRLREGDIVELTETGQKIPQIAAELVKNNKNFPSYASFDEKLHRASFLRRPFDVTEVPYPFIPEVNLIVEFYSK